MHPHHSRPPKEPLSQLLLRLANEPEATDAVPPEGQRISIGALLRLLEGRSAPALLLIFALPNVLPMPPGVSGLLGLPLVYLSWQLMMGRRPWLPKVIGERSVTRADFQAIMTKVIPFLGRAERLLQPRLPLMTKSPATQIIGGVCLLLSVILLLPIPLGNMLPALAITLFALGLLEKDGVCTILAAVVALVSLTVVWGVLWAMVEAVFLLLP